MVASTAYFLTLVASRSGKPIRLTYDHKGSDPAEIRRIKESGGFVINQRVNGISNIVAPAHRLDIVYAGVLAVTRSLGDYSMKEYVIGNPYTAAIEIGDQDDGVIIACDGVRICEIVYNLAFLSNSYGMCALTVKLSSSSKEFWIRTRPPNCWCDTPWRTTVPTMSAS